MDYKEFVSCLIRVAQKCYPSSEHSESSMQQLLMDNILPLAKRRRCIPLNSFVSQPMVESLFTYYHDALEEIFRHYANSSDHKSRSMLKSMSAKSKTFDEEKVLIAEAKERSQTQAHAQNRMGYSEFLSFANEFGLSSRYTTDFFTIDVYFILLSFFMCISLQHGINQLGSRGHLPHRHIAEPFRNFLKVDNVQRVLGSFSSLCS